MRSREVAESFATEQIIGGRSAIALVSASSPLNSSRVLELRMYRP